MLKVYLKHQMAGQNPRCWRFERCCIQCIQCIKSMLIRAHQLRWAGHAVCTEESRIPKNAVFYNQPSTRTCAKYNPKVCKMDLGMREHTTFDKTGWNNQCHTAAFEFDENRVKSLCVRELASQSVGFCPHNNHICSNCDHICKPRIGLKSHLKVSGTRNWSAESSSTENVGRVHPRHTLYCECFIILPMLLYTWCRRVNVSTLFYILAVG